MHHLNRCMLKLQIHRLEEMLLGISKPVSATESQEEAIPTIPRLTTKPPNTFIIVCPAIMLANNLTDKLIGLLKYKPTITTINGNKTIGTPLGTNILGNLTI